MMNMEMMVKMKQKMTGANEMMVDEVIQGDDSRDEVMHGEMSDQLS